MRVSKNVRNPAIRRPEVRSIKIQPRYCQRKYSSKDVPEIMLRGEWLRKLGFSDGKRVIIATMDELLIIRLQPESKLSSQGK